MTWGCDNSRGDQIDDFIADNNIHVCLLNDGSYSYFHPATRTFTAIYLSLCSLYILMEIDFMVESHSIW